jgi:hypothetical protein
LKKKDNQNQRVINLHGTSQSFAEKDRYIIAGPVASNQPGILPVC